MRGLTERREPFRGKKIQFAEKQLWITDLPAGLRGRVILGKGNRMDINELGTNLAEVGTDCISRQAACEYCHEDSDGYVMPLEKNCHAFIRYGMNGWELSLKAKGWHGSAKIKYCPICGRSLTHE